MAYLNETGLAHFWSKLKEKFLPLTGGTIKGNLTVAQADDEGGAITAKELVLGGNYVNDVVIANGTSGLWKYIKYASGIAVCWYSSARNNVVINQSWGSNLYADNGTTLAPVSYPFSFTATPAEFVSWHGGSTSVWVASGTYAPSSGKTAPYRLIASGQQTASGTVSYFVAGRWK